MDVCGNHRFALFCKQLSESFAVNDQLYIVTDKELLYRIAVVLRMHVGDQCILFDRGCNIECSVQCISKKEVVFTVLGYEKNVALTPFIRLYLPILKRVHLEDAVLFAGQVGVSEIQLITTEKSARTSARDDRLDRIIIGACEQAKQFAIPYIYQPISLPDALDRHSLEHAFVCAQDGEPFSLFQQTLKGRIDQQWECNVFVGPEQDFTQSEYSLFTQKNISLISLGSLVLQASVAACVSIALIRASFFVKK